MKPNGVKAVVTLTSSLGQMGRVSESARALDTPLSPFDTFQFAYKVSKAALNQGAPTPPAPRCRGVLAVSLAQFSCLNVSYACRKHELAPAPACVPQQLLLCTISSPADIQSLKVYALSCSTS